MDQIIVEVLDHLNTGFKLWKNESDLQYNL